MSGFGYETATVKYKSNETIEINPVGERASILGSQYCVQNFFAEIPEE